MAANISVIGGGSWATAIVKVLTQNGFRVHWWVRREDQQKQLQERGVNPDYLSAVQVSTELITVSTSLSEVLEEAPKCLLALPSSFLEEALAGQEREKFRDKLMISAVKGLVPHRGKIVSDFLQEDCGVPEENIVALGGPCHAEEVATEKRSYLTFAARDKNTANDVAQAFNCHFINTNIVDDLKGFEYAAVLKNIYAIAAGICHGAGMGDNFQAVLVSNCLREMKTFLESVNGSEVKLLDTAYTGDLLVTTYSRHSRNRNFGNMIGRGYSLHAAKLEMHMIAEGFYALEPMNSLVEKKQLNAPVVSKTYEMVFGNADAKEKVLELADSLI